MHNVVDEFKLLKFADCDLVTFPKENKFIYLVVSGRVNVISSEAVYNAIEKTIKRTRKKALAEYKKKCELYGQEYVGKEPLKFVTDFPEEKFRSGDFKRLKPNQTFGNDKLITMKGYRPSFVLAEGLCTSVL